MTTNDLPKIIPIFPLHGVLLMPGGELPLNIFEPRYLEMFDYALRNDRLIGMIQPKKHGEDDIYSVGCAGKIKSFEETSDGRYEVVLCGLNRFKVIEEVKSEYKFRKIKVDWADFQSDLGNDTKCLGLPRDRLKELLHDYFKREGMECSWHAIDNNPDGRIMTCLAMACPLPAAEKQALLEEKSCKKRASMFMTLLEMELHKIS